MPNLRMSVFIGAALSVTFYIRSAQGAFLCELYEHLPNEPGGDAPSEVYFTDIDSTLRPDLIGSVEAACRGALKIKARRAWYVRDVAASSLPKNWQESDLFTAAKQKLKPPPPPQRGYACRLFDKPLSSPGGETPVHVFYTNVLTWNRVVDTCKEKMRTLISSRHRNWELRSVPSLPEHWQRSNLF